MQLTQSQKPPGSKAGVLLGWVVLVAAVGWMISRVWVGVDFTDEMQYYGEIESLTRTGRFFQDDLFLQQLGYLFVLSFFKLHAFFFPDQSYLLVFGRLLLLAAYGATGARFSVAATKLGFSPAQKWVALAAFFSWIPFQIFAFSYNSTSYLLIVALVAEWMTRDPIGVPTLRRQAPGYHRAYQSRHTVQILTIPPRPAFTLPTAIDGSLLFSSPSYIPQFYRTNQPIEHTWKNPK